MKKYRKHYYVKGMNTKYLTPLVCSPRMVRAPRSARPQELDLPGTMKEWRTETQKIWNQLGLMLSWRLLRVPDLTCSLYTIEQESRAIAYSWMRRQAYLIPAGTVSRDAVFRGKKTMVGIVCIHCRQTWSRLYHPYEPHLKKALNSQGLFKVLASLVGPCPCQQPVDSRDFPWSFQLIYVDGNHKSSSSYWNWIKQNTKETLGKLLYAFI